MLIFVFVWMGSMRPSSLIMLAVALVLGISAALLSNTVSGSLVDASNGVPGSVYKDSVVVRLSYPNGSGGTTTASVNPSAKGNFSFPGVPIGNHSLTIIYLPDTDTVTHNVSVHPNGSVKIRTVFPADLW